MWLEHGRRVQSLGGPMRLEEWILPRPHITSDIWLRGAHIGGGSRGYITLTLKTKYLFLLSGLTGAKLIHSLLSQIFKILRFHVQQ